MSIPRRLLLALQALRELGPRSLVLYARYRLGLSSGYLRWRTPEHQAELRSPGATLRRVPAITLPDRAALVRQIGENGRARLLAEADEVVAGWLRFFSGEARRLQLVPPGPLAHWTAYLLGKRRWGVPDVKFLWEPGRFGWAFVLGRAYHVSQDNRYARTFWSFTETFLEANPANMGPHWASAQEVALRLIALVYAYLVFGDSAETTPGRVSRLERALAAHAARIPPTLVYARAQKNNHLLTEAVGLYTAGAVMPDHPQARRWRDLGWHWLNRALQSQIGSDGAYIQHSANYHRLMLQAALWAAGVARTRRQALPPATRRNLAAATRWALALVDPVSGRLPNLGPNDGAYILPLTICPFQDHRPVLQAAAQAFLGEKPFPPGPWDELSMWIEPQVISPDAVGEPPSSPACVLRLPDSDSWAYLRAARFKSRPGHADQLHLDLWWRGLNVAQDPGTYLYNAPPPWENALAGTAVHNTLTVNGQDQMRRAGRFLWLDWAQGRVVNRQEGPGDVIERLEARHDGFRRMGYEHHRVVTARRAGRWVVTDRVVPLRSPSRIAACTVRLHWLLPDWPWELQGTTLRVHSRYGWVTLHVRAEGPMQDSTKGARRQPQVQLTRAGELLAGQGPVSPTWGWVSLTYGHKAPALSFALVTTRRAPIILFSEWDFP